MRIGIFGGSFNPIHNGHLFVAETVLKEFDLDRILFIPAFVNPFKQDHDKVVDDMDRYEMSKMAVADHPQFQVDDYELKKEGPSYTVATLQYFSNEIAEAEWFLIMGGDSLAGFPRWKNADKILNLATLIVYGREGSDFPEDFDFKDRLLKCQLDLPIDISSTLIRTRIKDAKSFRYLIPDIVYRYIELKGLYRR